MAVRVVTDNRALFRAEYQKGLSARMGGLARLCAFLARQNAPRRSGRLAASIRAVGGGLKWSVVVGEPYGPLVEFGGAFTAAHPFLFPAFLATAQEARRGA